MPDDIACLSDLLSEVPEAIRAYYDRLRIGGYSGLEQFGVNLLPPGECAAVTREFRGFHPLIRQTGAVILDNANTSNYHCYAPDLPIPGSVFYLNHDGDTRIVFDSLADLLKAADQAKEQCGWLNDFHADFGPLAAQQERLNRRIGELYHSGDDDAEAAILLFVESSNLVDEALFERLATSPNFYLGEVIANTIMARPDAKLLRLATICSEHAHPQVSAPGKRALAAVRRLQQ